MKSSEIKSYEELPLFLNAETVAKVLGVSPSTGYELMLVVTSSISFALSQATRLIHFAAPPLPTKAKAVAFAGTPCDFPVLRVGSRMVVPKEKFIEWVSSHTRGGDTP